MTVTLPKAVRAYFDGTNVHDAEAIAQAFTADGVVHDEHKVHRGRAAIGVWARDTVGRYRMTTTAGTFPGSPIELTFRFELGDGAIRSLKIGN
jgi:nuclear transport factor 2 (NTF2) superfamily protein